MAHDKLSPSAAARWMACPGSIAAIATLPEALQNPSSSAAREGTAVHALLEDCLTTGKSLSTYEGQIISVDKEDNASLITRKRKTMVGETLYTVNHTYIEALAPLVKYLRERAAELGATLYSERKVNPLPERDDTKGTADASLDGWPTLEVWDYKNGKKTVEHKDNAQVLAYLLGLAQEMGWGYATYRVGIHQPYGTHIEKGPRFTEVTEAELREFEVKYREAARMVDVATSDKDKLRKPDWEAKYLRAGPHCYFCPKAGTCNIKLRSTLNSVLIDLPPMPGEEEPIRNAKPMEDIENAIYLMRHAADIRKHLDAAEAMVREALAGGKTLPGVRAEPGGGRREWLVKELTRAQEKRLSFFVPKERLKDIWNPKSLRTAVQVLALVPEEKKEQFSKEFIEFNKYKDKIIVE